MDKTRIIYLLEQELEGKLSAGELMELDELKVKEGNEELVQGIAAMIERQSTQPVMIDAEKEDEGFKKIMSIDEIPGEDIRTIPIPHRVHFLRTAWFRYAAAIIILFGIGTYIYINNQKEKPSVTQTNPVPVQNDVAPGGNRATLTLADGSKIILDSAANGKLAEQGTMTIEKRGEKIIYSPLTTHHSPLPVSYNTMSTPRGGQYQLTLPDGSQVWLNAESSITYPTAFTGKERRVTITGEAYFEVAKDKKKPFIVSALLEEGRREKGENKTLEIEVLGTHFNINAYKEEPTINTTLLEGSVRLKNTSSFSLLPSPQNSVLTSLTLKPGQQGQLKGQQLSLAANPDTEQVMAWKNGVFNFDNADLQAVMRQLARWYDVEVVYEGKIPQKTFGGRMGRDLNLSQVLKVLSALGVKFRIEGKKLIVTQK